MSEENMPHYRQAQRAARQKGICSESWCPGLHWQRDILKIPATILCYVICTQPLELQGNFRVLLEKCSFHCQDIMYPLKSTFGTPIHHYCVLSERDPVWTVSSFKNSPSGYVRHHYRNIHADVKQRYSRCLPRCRSFPIWMESPRGKGITTIPIVRDLTRK